LALAASEYLETIKNIPIPSRPTLRNSTVVAVVSLGRWGSAETKNCFQGIVPPRRGGLPPYVGPSTALARLQKRQGRAYGRLRGIQRGNWIQTIPGKGWFAILRLYSPLERFFRKSGDRARLNWFGKK